jgi:DNA-binding response OmpR family regulator
MLIAQSYDLAILDLGLPRLDGFEVLRRLRSRENSVPVLILTARDAVEDRVRGLDLGADDYLAKPFEMRELMARIRAVLRRYGGSAVSVLGNGEIELDLATHEARYRGKSLILSAREFALMRALLDRPGTILSRTQLEEKIYGWGEEVESNAIDVLIHYLRRKFDKDVVRNVRGAGWRVPKVPG